MFLEQETLLAVHNCTKLSKKKIKLLFISSDGVYPSTEGGYKKQIKLNHTIIMVSQK